MSFLDFYSSLYEEKSFDYNSSQLDIYDYLAVEKINNFSIKNIPDSKLKSDDSRQDSDDFHITVLYGLLDNDFNEFAKVVHDSGITKIQVKLGKISKFANENEDVIYISVIPDYNLNALHGFLKNNTRHIETHPEYTPHITLAYVKPNSCDHLLGDDTFEGDVLIFNCINFSNKDGVKTTYWLGSSLIKEEVTSVAPDSVKTGQFMSRWGVKKVQKREIAEKVVDKLKGGKADKIADSNFDKKELELGIEEESEHTKDKQIAKEIAKDHLVEDPKYYSRRKLYTESVSSENSSKYARAKQLMLSYKGWGIWADHQGNSYHWDGNTFKKVDDEKTKHVSNNLRDNGYHVKHFKDNVLVSKRKENVDEEQVKNHLNKHFKDQKFKTHKIKTTDTDGKDYHSVLVKHIHD